MNIKPMNVKHWSVATAISISMLLTVPSPVDAAAQTSLTPRQEARIQAMCKRLPNLIKRTDNQLTRLPAGPNTKGSIAFVKARAERAAAKGRTQRSKTLTERADKLTQKLALLPNQKAALLKAQDACNSLGFGS